MCFILYMAADQPIPTIPWDNNSPSFYTSDLEEGYEVPTSFFSKPHRKHIGSDVGCGCGFRNALFQNGEWPEEDMPDWCTEEEYLEELKDKQKNHQQLHDFIRKVVGDHGEVELYGQWEGGKEKPEEIQCSTIPLSRILEVNFFFRDRYGYIVDCSS